MRQPITIRLDPAVLDSARAQADFENRTLTNYIETLIKKDVAMHEAPQIEVESIDDEKISVFIAEPITKRWEVIPSEGDTPEELADRQDVLDALTGFGCH